MLDARRLASARLAILALALALVGCPGGRKRPPEADADGPAEALDLSHPRAYVGRSRTDAPLRPDPRVLLRRPTVRGALSRAAAARVIRGNLQDIRFCYDQGLQRDPTLEGVVTISFEINARGRASNVFVLGSTLADASVSRCVARATGDWRFPHPRDGGDVKVTYPVLLEPG